MSKTKTDFFSWQNFLKFETLLFLLCCLVLALGISLIFLDKLVNLSDQIRYFGFAFGIMSIMHAAKQFQANHDWNRRQLAITSAKQVKDDLNKHVIVLDEAFNYVHRKKSNPISVEEIHKKICKKDENGELLLKDGKLIVDCDDSGCNVRKAIMHVLNAYEYLAAGIYQGVFDQAIIESLFRGAIIKHHQVFGAYIAHFNNEMYPERNGAIWEHFKQLAVEFESNGEKLLKKRKGADS